MSPIVHRIHKTPVERKALTWFLNQVKLFSVKQEPNTGQGLFLVG